VTLENDRKNTGLSVGSRFAPPGARGTRLRHGWPQSPN